MASELKAVPDEMGLAAAAEFWAEHSVAEVPTRLVELDYQPAGHLRLVAIEGRLVQLLEARARVSGVSVETLVTLWLQERLSA